MIPESERQRRFFEKGYRWGLRNAGAEMRCPIKNANDKTWWWFGYEQATGHLLAQLKLSVPVLKGKHGHYDRRGWAKCGGGWRNTRQSPKEG